MQKIRCFLLNFFRFLPWVAAITPAVAVDQQELDEEVFWKSVYDSRENYYESNIGPLPEDILKMMNMSGVWPGGGLYVLPASKLSEGLWAYTTFGLTNSDMPASAKVADYQVEKDEQGRPSKYSSSLESKEKTKGPLGFAGYGYEIMMLTTENEEWPLWFIQWVVNMEISNDIGLLGRVEQYDGLTVQDIQVGEDEVVDVLIAFAQEPYPSGTTLPNGEMRLLVATVITNEEMQWSMENGRGELLKRLSQSGVGQVSDRNRESVFLN